MITARVTVMPKPVLNDPQGVTVRQGLHALGFGEVFNVRVGKLIELTLDVASEAEAGARVDEMCRKLLANGVIEDYRFELIQDKGKGEASLAPTRDEHA